MDAKADFIVIGELDKTPSEQAREQAASNSRAINDKNSGAQGGCETVGVYLLFSWRCH